MPDLNATRAALENHFLTGWGSTSPVAHSNSNFDDTLNQSHVKIKVLFVESENITIGAAVAGCERQRHFGLVKLIIYIPLNTGTGDAYDLSDSYKTLMDNKEIVSNLFTGATSVREAGEEKQGYWSLLCFTKFHSDE